MHREGGLWELVVYFASEGSYSAKYTLYHNSRERLNSYNYVVTVCVNMLNHSTSKGERGASRENELPMRTVSDLGSRTCCRFQLKTSAGVSSCLLLMA